MLMLWYCTVGNVQHTSIFNHGNARWRFLMDVSRTTIKRGRSRRNCFFVACHIFVCVCFALFLRDTNMETSSSQSHSCLKCNIKDRTEIQGEMHESYWQEVWIHLQLSLMMMIIYHNTKNVHSYWVNDFRRNNSSNRIHFMWLVTNFVLCIHVVNYLMLRWLLNVWFKY